MYAIDIPEMLLTSVPTTLSHALVQVADADLLQENIPPIGKFTDVIIDLASQGWDEEKLWALPDSWIGNISAIPWVHSVSLSTGKVN